MTSISTLTIDKASITKRSREIEHEISVAINDLIEWNHFEVKNKSGENVEGPYTVTLGTSDNRISLKVEAKSLSKPMSITVSVSPFRSLIRDYFLICESYFEAVKQGNLPKIEAIDMSRRGLHNEGAELLTSLTQEKVVMDYETARRLFTLICALHLK